MSRCQQLKVRPWLMARLQRVWEDRTDRADLTAAARRMLSAVYLPASGCWCGNRRTVVLNRAVHAGGPGATADARLLVVGPSRASCILSVDRGSAPAETCRWSCAARAVVSLGWFLVDVVERVVQPLQLGADAGGVADAGQFPHGVPGGLLVVGVEVGGGLGEGGGLVGVVLGEQVGQVQAGTDAVAAGLFAGLFDPVVVVPVGEATGVQRRPPRATRRSASAGSVAVPARRSASDMRHRSMSSTSALRTYRPPVLITGSILVSPAACRIRPRRLPTSVDSRSPARRTSGGGPERLHDVVEVGAVAVHGQVDQQLPGVAA